MKIVHTLLAASVIAATALTACGSSSPKASPTTQKGDGWQIDFPNKVTASTQNSNGLDIQIYLAKANGDAYTASEFAIPAGNTFDLDGGVTGAVNGMRGTENVAEVELVSSDSITTPDGSEGRTYQATITGKDGKTATTNGVIVNHHDTVVQASMLDLGTNNESDSADFLASLKFD